MPIKSSFCQRKYTRAGPYEKYLRTAHANLDIVLSSTVGNTSSTNTNSDVKPDLLYHEGQEQFDFDDESQPGPTEYALDALTEDVAHESDSKILDDFTTSLPGRLEHFEQAGETIAEVNGFEHKHHSLCDDLWALFLYCNILDYVRYLLRQVVYRDNLVYAQLREYDYSRKRIYTEMHTADCWWDVQVLLPNLFYASVC